LTFQLLEPLRDGGGDQTGADPAAILAAARSAGYPIDPHEDVSPERDGEEAALARSVWIAAALVLPVFLVEMGGHFIPGVHALVGETIGHQTSRVLQFLLIGAGDPVTGGTVNGAGLLEVRVSEVGADTVLARIIRMVQDAQGAKLPVQAVIDRVTGVFAPVVLGIAVVTVLVWLVFGPGLGEALVAVETADVVLISGDPAGVVRALGLSRAAMRNIHQNFGWAFGYNVLLIPVATGVLYPVFGLVLSPMLAAGAMAFSSVAVVTNALRLRTFGEST